MPLIIDRLAYGIGYDTAGLAAGERAIGASLGRVGALIKSPVGIAIGLGTAMVAAGAHSTAVASRWQSDWAEVRTIMGGTEAEIAAIEKRVLGMTDIIPQDSSLLAKGYYEILSAGISDANDALNVLRVSAKVATAGLTTTATAVDAITTIINAYGMAAEDATKISDLLFFTVDQGKITFEELANSVGTAIPFFATAGIALEDLLAAVATLTKGGRNADETMTALRGVVAQLIKPQEEAVKLAEQLGIEFTAQAVAAKGLVPWLAEVAEKTKGSAEAQAVLFGDVRGLAAVLSLAGKQAEEFARIQERMGDAEGTAQRAFEVMSGTLENQAQLVKNRLNRNWVEFGNNFLVTVGRGIDAVEGLFGTSMEQRIERAGRLTREMKTLTGDTTSLIDRYAELSGQENRTAEETKELHDITQALAQVYPNAVTGVNEFGIALGLYIDKLREAREESRKAIGEQMREDFRGAIKEIQRARNELGLWSARLNQLKDAEVVADPLRGGREIARAPLNTREMREYMGRVGAVRAELEDLFVTQGEFTRSELDAEIQRLTRSLPLLRENLGSVTDAFVELVQAAGLTDTILEMDDLRRAVASGELSGEIANRTEEMREFQEILSLVFGSSDPADYAELLEAVVQRLREAHSEAVKFGDTSPFQWPTEEPPPAVETAIERLQKRAAEIRQREEEKVIEHIARVQGVRLSEAQFQALQELEPEFVGVMRAGADEFERQMKDKLERLQGLHQKLIAQAAATEQRKAFAQGFGARGGMGPDDPALGREVIPDPDTVKDTKDEVTALEQALEQLEIRLGPLGLGGVVRDFIANLKLDDVSIGQALGDAISANLIGIGANIFGKALGGLFGGPSEAERLERATKAIEDFVNTITQQELGKTKARLAELKGIYEQMTDLFGDRTFEEFVSNHTAEEWAVFIGLFGRTGARNFDQFLEMIREAEEFIENFGKFADTFTGQLDKLRYEFDLFDITDPAEQLSRMLELLARFADIDLTKLKELSPENFEKAIELIGGLLTGVLPGELTADNPYVQQLADLLGISNEEALALLEAIRDVDGLTADELRRILGEMEDLNDQIQDQGEADADTDVENVSRSITLTAEQGRSLIGIGNSQLAAMDSMNMWLSDIAANVRAIYEQALGYDLPGPEDGVFAASGDVVISGDVYITIPGSGDPAATASAVQASLKGSRLRADGIARRHTVRGR